ncbi:hypothetical protein QR680_011577 [Steinernema hermaphroditum]|uniref:tRNA pseudouridine(55) synthase n=1 Tax=Steinernema hermaphroditum TaxID=289476 RepID=A0AA39LYB1_9BILA|nr:hypothetical protein QR680_011577 [Steinernema hermaphroditum]
MQFDEASLNSLLCSSCIQQVAGFDSLQPTENSWNCVLCFGITDDSFASKVAEEAKAVFDKNPYDSKTFSLSLDFPTTLILREHIFEKIFLAHCKGTLATVPFKVRCTELYIRKIEAVTSLRPTPSSDLGLTISFANNEFNSSDSDFLFRHLPVEFCSGGKKRRLDEDYEEGLAARYTKVKVTNIMGKLSDEARRSYKFENPTQACEIVPQFEREAVYIAGRYCKFSRNLPQTKWTDEENTTYPLPDSVADIISRVLIKFTKADNSRFSSSGREDIDVRMLGTGRPFCVQLLNSHNTQQLRGEKGKSFLRELQEEINKSEHINVRDLCRVTKEHSDTLNTVVHEYDEDDNGIEKRKSYTALCYSSLPISRDAFESLTSQAPLEIVQPTVVRVLKRRPLIDRRRTIFKMEALLLDDHHFYLKVETQAGTYIKEFVHGDFGRTQPSIAELLQVEQGEVDILELDVDTVLVEWPPASCL